jgi:hypothetical protein
MKPIVIIDARAGSIARYETGGERPRKTHVFVMPEDYPRPVGFDEESVMRFRISPPDELAVPAKSEKQAGAT